MDPISNNPALTSPNVLAPDSTAPANSTTKTQGSTKATIVPEVPTDTTGATQSLEDKPRLSTPNPSSTDATYQAQVLSGSYVALASLGANVMALIEQAYAEMAKDNREIRHTTQELAIDQMEKQADTMREKAIVQLVLGVVSGAMSIAGGLMQGISAGQTIKARTDFMNDVGASNISQLTQKQTQQLQLNTAQAGAKMDAWGKSVGGTGGALGQISQAVGGIYDSEIKLQEANQKTLEAQADRIKDVIDSLEQAIRKAIDTSTSLAQSSNETLRHILA